MLREIPAVFSSEGHLLHGTFFRTSESLSERAPCVLVTGSWLNVKEQIATTWARALAERGLNTFVFDFTGWGESGGESRNLEMPTAKVRDMMQAVEHVSSMSFAGASRRTACRVCQCPVRTPRNRTWGAHRCICVDRGVVPRLGVGRAVLRRERRRRAADVIVHSDGCALPDNARTVHARLAGAKELAWLPNGTQTDYYDLPQYVSPAAERAAEFFSRTLGG